MLQIPSSLSKIKPVQGFSHAIHIGLNVLLPLMVYILVRINFVPLAIALILLSKWRMFAVRPRYWIATVISNGVDIIVGVAFVLFMASTSVVWWQLFWAVLYDIWLVWLKPRSDVLAVSIQAIVGQLLGLSVVYLKFGDASLPVLIAATWGVTYVAARHFLTSFEEPHSALLAHVWAYFSASLAFILGHWLLFYGTVPQILVLLTTIGYSMAALYYLDATDRLTELMQRQLITITLAIIVIVIVLSDWTGATI